MASPSHALHKRSCENSTPQKTKVLNAIYQLTSETYNDLGEEVNTSLSGITGVGWVTQHLTQLGIFSKSETIDYLEPINQFVLKSLYYDIDNNNYDLMHGYIGKLIYLITASKNSIYAPKLINEILSSINYFKQSAIQETSEAIYWEKPNSGITGNSNKVCLGMAHGMPSIISFLCLLLQEFKLSISRISSKKG